MVNRDEAAKKASILDTLPEHIALLDAQGLIISVNEAWRRFGSANAIQGSGNEVGVNYLEVCESARGDGSSEAHQVAEGIRSVLGGRAKSFSIEYPCHSPSEQRWFLLTVTPSVSTQPSGAVVMHSNITERKRGEGELRRFAAATDAIADALYLVDRSSMSFVHVNDAACRMQNRTREELLALGPEGVLATSREELERTYDTIIASGVEAKPLEMLRRRQDGSEAWVELRRHAHGSGDRWTIVTWVRDITQRKEAENRIKRLNRVYAVLSGINTLIVRVRDRDELFREACRIAVDVGAFSMAWIGEIDPQTLDSKVVASHGVEQGLIDKIKFTARDGTPESERPASRAWRELRPVFSNDIATDLSLVSVRDDLLRRGRRSVGCFPLTVDGRPEAVIALFASESNAFDDEETLLLLELTANLSFALNHIEKEKRLNYLAYYDSLTGLANRSLFQERLGQFLSMAGRESRKLPVLVVDIERFRTINETFGRPAGDELLKQVAERAKSHITDVSWLARIGGDQFAAMIPDVATSDAVRRIEQGLHQVLGVPFRLGESEVRVSVKIGIALFPDDGADADILLRHAEAALKKAKSSGERYLFYTQEMTARVAENLALENRLRQAIEKEEFVLHYQPKVNLATGKLTSVEALIRWNDPRTGLVPPGRFIPILEETGLINDVGRWALRKAIQDYLRWRAAGLAAVRVAVNMSPLQLRNPGFVAEIEQVIGVDPHAAAGLELEITESLIMADVKHSIASLQAIRAMGVSIAIDDFGTGFSSLNYLAKLPVDTLKIDRSFVIEMTSGPQGLALVSTIINLAHSLKLKVVAEGVETEEQSGLLRSLSCDEMQGYLFSRPVPFEQMTTMLAQETKG